MKRLYFNIDKENNKVILDRKDFDYLMSIGHYNDKAIEYIENNWIEYSDFQYVDNDDELNIDCESIKELLDILKGSNNE